MNIIEYVKKYHQELIYIRQKIHAHPELAFEEYRTSELIADKLSSWGIEVHKNIGTTGIVGTLINGKDSCSIGLRADMDTLPITEANAIDYRSCHDGKMHACGHDGHTTMLLGAARYLAETKNFDGRVHFIFQPAEEGFGGARAMIKDGLFQRFPCDAIFGMHNSPNIAVGEFFIRPDVMMAGGAFFDIKINGAGAHAARPELSIDPIMLASQIITMCQTIVPDNVKPQETAVLSFTQIHAGDAYNVIPAYAKVAGTVRAFSQNTMKTIEENLYRIANSIATSAGASIDFDFRTNFIPLINDETQTAFAEKCAAMLVGDKHVHQPPRPSMAAEDFADMLAACPGAYIFIGNGMSEAGQGQLHSASYNFNDEILPLGAAYYATLVEEKLKKQ